MVELLDDDAVVRYGCTSRFLENPLGFRAPNTDPQIPLLTTVITD